MAHGQHVLVLDGLAETEEVLKAVLEPRGLQVNRIRGDIGNQTADGHRPPQLMVIHQDDKSPGCDNHHRWQDVPRIIIGSAEMHDYGPNGSNGHYLQQPFQYGELIQAIETLLQTAD